MTSSDRYDRLLSILSHHAQKGHSFAVAAALSVPQLHTDPLFWASLSSSSSPSSSSVECTSDDNASISPWHCELLRCILTNSIASTDGETQFEGGGDPRGSLTPSDLHALLLRCGTGLRSIPVLRNALFALEGGEQQQFAVVETEDGGQEKPNSLDLEAICDALKDAAALSRKRSRSPSTSAAVGSPVARETPHPPPLLSEAVVPQPPRALEAILQPPLSGSSLVQSILSKYQSVPGTARIAASFDDAMIPTKKNNAPQQQGTRSQQEEPKTKTSSAKRHNQHNNNNEGDDSSTTTTDDDEVEEFPTPPKTDLPSKKRRHAFSAQEDHCIVQGMGRFAPNPHRFTNILNAYREVWAPSRTAQHLYDRWRNVLKQRAVYAPQKK